jgi:hypothetical protein
MEKEGRLRRLASAREELGQRLQLGGLKARERRAKS